MTTPNQDAPDGAVTVGGGVWNFGQLVNEEAARSQFEIEAPTSLADALDLLPIVLGQLPQDSLKPWHQFLGLPDEDLTNGNVVQGIVDALADSPLKDVIGNVQKVVDNIFQAINGGSSTNNPLETIKTNLTKAWADFWDGLTGDTGTTSKLPSDVRAAAGAVRSTANTASTNAATADAKAITADGKAVTADGKAVTAQTNVQGTVDNIYRSVFGGTSTNNPITSVISSLQKGWAEFWDGLNGTTGTASKLPSEVRTAAASVRSTASTGVTNAATADAKAVTADGKAVTAQNVLNLKSQDFTNMVPGSDFESATQLWGTASASFSIATDDFRSGVKSLKIVGTSGAQTGIAYDTASPNYEVKEGDQFFMELWVKKSADYANTDVGSDPRFRLIRGTGSAPGNTLAHIALLPAAITTTNWTKLTALCTIPAGVHTIQFLFTGPKTNLMTGTLWVDDIVVRRVVKPEELAPLDGSKIATGTVAEARVQNLTSTKNTANAAQSAAATADSKAVTADGKAVTADGKAVAAQSTANTATTNAATADAKAVTANTTAATASSNVNLLGTNLLTQPQTVLGSIANVVMDGAQNVSTFLSSIWEGLTGQTGTGKTIANVKVAASAVNSTANTANTTAGTAVNSAATADAKAVVAQSITSQYMQSGANLIPNPGWDNENFVFSGSGSISTEEKRSGTKSLKMTSTATHTATDLFVNNTGTYKVRAEAGEVYYVEFWIRGDGQVSSGQAGLYATIFNPDGTFLQWGQLVLATLTTANRNVWTKYTGFITIPANAASFTVSVSVRSNVPTGHVLFFDDIVCREVTEGNLAKTNAAAAQDAASTADGKAVTADGKAVTAQAAASTADGKAVTAQGALSTYMTAGQNLCSNPSFENINFQSAKLNADYSTEQSRSGTRSIKMTRVSTSSSNFHIFQALDSASIQHVPARPSDVFYCEFWIRGHASNVSTAGLARMVLQFVTETKVHISYQIPQITTTTALNGVWTKVSGYATAPANTALVRAYCEVINTAAENDIFYFDDVVVQRVTEGYVADGKAVAAHATANTATTNAATADGKAVTADGKAVAADGKAVTADGKAVTADEKAVTAQASANTGITNAATAQGAAATADGKAVVADGKAQNAFNKLAGVLSTGEDSADATVIENVVEALLKTYNTLQDHSADIQALKSDKASSQVKGSVFNINFSDYTNGAFSTTAAPGTNSFFVTYGPGGTSTLGVQNGVAQWYSTNNADRNATLIWNKPTNTDFQVISGTMTTPPQQPGGGAGTPKFHAIGRVNSAGNTYVWARAYSDGFLSFKGEIGCTVNGVETQWVGNIPLTWSLDMRFVVGVGVNARQYQVYSGSTLVWTHTESGSASTNYGAKTSTSTVQSTLGASNRQWGAIAQICGGTGGPYHSGKVGATSVSDNEAPQVFGSAARMDRTSVATVSYVGAGALTAIPNSFFNVVEYQSRDIVADSATSSFTVKESKPYIVTGRVMTGNIAAWGTLILQVWNGTQWVNSQYGDPIYTQDGVAALYGQWIQYLTADQKVRLAYERAGTTLTTLTGEATGSKSYFSIVGAG